MGPTEVLPGFHLLFSLNQYMAHYSAIRGGVVTAAPAGSIFVTSYGIWHRRTASTSHVARNLLKFWYLRTVPPCRDWITETHFELADAFHAEAGNTFGREIHRTKNEAAELFYWFAGRHGDFVAIVPGSNLPVYFGNRAETQSGTPTVTAAVR